MSAPPSSWVAPPGRGLRVLELRQRCPFFDEPVELLFLRSLLLGEIAGSHGAQIERLLPETRLEPLDFAFEGRDALFERLDLPAAACRFSFFGAFGTARTGRGRRLQRLRRLPGAGHFRLGA